MRIAGYKIEAITKDAIKIGCQISTRPEILQLLNRMEYAPKTSHFFFNPGAAVKVIRVVMDSDFVLGCTGIALNLMDGNKQLIRFEDCPSGLGIGSRNWFVHPDALQQVKKRP